MFGGKKKESKRTSRSNNKYDIPNPMDFGINPADDDDDDDEALEAELRRLTSGDGTTYERAQPKAPPRKPKVNIEEIEKMSDEEMSDDDGEDDPAYLDELKGILGEEIDDTEDKIENKEEEKVTVNPDQATNENITIIEERITMYKAAENKAKADNEISKARRFTRGLKTLNELLKSVKAGNTINVDDIPPVLPHSALPKDPNQNEPENKALPVVDEPVPTPEEPVVPVEEPTPQKVPVDEEKLELLKKRQREYKIAALKWKKAENVEEALKYIKISKQFDTVINALLSGEPIDLSDMPPPPSLPMSTAENPINTEAQEKQENETQEASELAPVTGSGIEGALKERLEVYRRAKTVAEEENNTRKSRQYGRICKQYEDAIKLFTRGKTIPIDELPIPPGFPPIALEQSNPPAVSNSSIVTPSVPSRPAPQPPTDTSNSQIIEPKKLEEPKKPSAMTRADKQILLLQKRQAELKRAALTAKKDGDIELAKEYLRQAKGIDPLINASRSGLPVDMTSIPISPNAKNQLLKSTDKSSDDNFTIISAGEVTPINENSTDQEIYDNLEATLIKHKKMCLSTRDHTKALGDVPGYNRWERLALGYTKDLDMLRVQRREGLKPPRHHYEVRTYSIVQSSTDVSDGDVEISIIRGIDYSKEADTYVIYEFPYPSDNSPTDRTSTIKASNNPEYEATFTLNGIIDRSSRPCQRAFKRHALKCQVWSKGCSMNPLLCCTHPSGFFRSDSLLGTVTVKLQPLETQCTLHDSFPLMNGRKPAGGKLEVKIRLRDPITTKQIEKMTDKWLIIDN
ncbi:coiled-coil and C2 domain-containing protein 1-like isoform X2 [Aphidius gifuensis]|uniref:coiled-coil and C2 domain-containing protein 1-like isoform X2 n=1 Tax=Aphidius gifuensis TaxID=684658 RepID=UPI001CDC2C27|nr:coiled-coil and C2 domain-containing protein 1-like isoform X2 [Aphidius gifuensis]